MIRITVEKLPENGTEKRKLLGMLDIYGDGKAHFVHNSEVWYKIYKVLEKEINVKN